MYAANTAIKTISSFITLYDNDMHDEQIILHRLLMLIERAIKINYDMCNQMRVYYLNLFYVSIYYHNFRPL